MRRSIWVWFLVALYFAVVSWALLHLTLAHAHEWYTDLHDKTGQYCCNGQDCSVSHFKLNNGHYSFMTREGHWVEIKTDRITFLPVPGDPGPAENDPDPSHYAHLCYKQSEDMHGNGPADEYASEDGEEYVHLYCAFIKPEGF